MWSYIFSQSAICSTLSSFPPRSSSWAQQCNPSLEFNFFFKIAKILELVFSPFFYSWREWRWGGILFSLGRLKISKFWRIFILMLILYKMVALGFIDIFAKHLKIKEFFNRIELVPKNKPLFVLLTIYLTSRFLSCFLLPDHQVPFFVFLSLAVLQYVFIASNFQNLKFQKFRFFPLNI